MQIILNSLVISYERYSSRNNLAQRNLILLHGWGCDSSIWNNILDDLAISANVIVLDLPGFGASSAPKTAFKVVDYVNIVSLFIQKLNLKNVTMLGHSFGGRVAIKYASLFPEQVSRLILVAPAGITINKHCFKNFCYKIVAKIGNIIFSLPMLNRYRDQARRKFYKQIDSVDYINSGILKETFLNVINEDLSPDASRVTAQTVIIYGVDDKDVELESVRRLCDLIKNSELKILENAGHFPWLGQKEKFIMLIKLILNFES